jgi:dipeptidase E
MGQVRALRARLAKCDALCSRLTHRVRRLKMRLAFYSDQVIDENASIDARVLQLIGVKLPRIGYVSSAPDPSRFYFEQKRSYYQNRGAELSMYVDAQSDDLERDLRSLCTCDAIHLSGGNTFVFLQWLRARNILPVLRSYAEEDRGVLIGTSAGAILMTPMIETALLCGDVRPSGFTDDTALGLVNFLFWPHYQRGAMPNIALDPRRLVYGCQDGTGIVVDGTAIELHGAVSVAQQSTAADAFKVTRL